MRPPFDPITTSVGTEPNRPAARFLLSRSCSLQKTLFTSGLFLFALSWAVNECRWCCGGCSGLITGVCASAPLGSVGCSQAAVKFFNFSADFPASINRRAKEVCLLAPPWLDLCGSAKGGMITWVSEQPEESKGGTSRGAPALAPLINHRNKYTNPWEQHQCEDKQKKPQRDVVSSKVYPFQTRRISDCTVSQSSTTGSIDWLYQWKQE